MKRTTVIVTIVTIATALALAITARAHPGAQITPPQTLSYQGHLLDANGDPVEDGVYEMAFGLWDAATSGSQLWGPETLDVHVDNGFFAVVLGSLQPIDPAILHTDTYLEISVGEETLTPRQQIASVAFALVAGDTHLLDGQEANYYLDWDNLMGIPADLDDGDDDTTYTAGTGLNLVGTEFSVDTTFRLPQTCVNGEIAEWNGATWQCGTDDVGTGGGGGDITAVTAGNGLLGGGETGDVTLSANFAGTGVANTVARSDHDHDGVYSLVGHTHPWGDLTDVPPGFADGVDDDTLGGLSCADGEVAKWNDIAAAWICAADDTGSGGGSGDITAVNAGTGLAGGGETGDVTLDVAESYRLPQTCANGEIAEWNGATWQCGTDDVGTGGGGGDITAVNAGAGLTGGGVSGDVTLNANFAGTGVATTVARSDHDHDGVYSPVGHTHPWGDLTDVPPGFADGVDDDTTYTAGTGLNLVGTEFSADTAYLQQRVSGTCVAGASIRVVNADGSVSCEVDDDTTYTAGNQLELVGNTFNVLETGLDADTLDGQEGAYYNNWTNLANIPADIADGDNDTTYTAGTGLDLTGTEFSADTAYLQQRVSGTCGAGSSIRVIASDGTVTCETDDGATYSAGNQLTLDGSTFNVTEGSGSGLDADLLDGQHGSYYNAWGNLTGVPAGLDDGDDDTTYSAGTGLDLVGTTFNADTAYLQRRVSGTCGTGNAIRVVNADGTVTCEPVGGAGGDITAVNAGTGLTGGGTSGDVTLDADTTYLQRRVGSTCAAGSSIRVIAEDGTVTCETDDDTDTTYTAGNQLSLTGTRFDVEEGAGSGLDADLLDGQDGSYYNNWNNLTGVPPGFADGVDNDSGGDITSVYSGDGLEGGGSSGSVTLELMGCNPQQMLQTRNYYPYAWQCIDAPSTLGDITSVGAGTGLTGGGTSGDVTLNADTTYLQRRVSGSCISGNAIRVIAEDGTVTCEPVAGGPHDHWGETWTGSGTGLTLSGGSVGIDASGTYGVYGTGYYGVYGVSMGTHGTGVHGDASSLGIYGVYGEGGVSAVHGSGGDYGVYSSGDMHATGDITCDGTKSSVANTERSGERLLYAIESPEVWFEDFGTASLVDGVVTVTIESVFAQTVNLTETYHVFVTPLSDEPILLFVTDKGPTSFTVRGVTLDGEPAKCEFDYRIAAKRLGYEDVRLEPVPEKLLEARAMDEEMAQEELHPVPEAFLDDTLNGGGR